MASCTPDCVCGKHNAHHPTCKSGCTCSKHLKHDCPEGCTCGRHPCPESCTCGRHFQGKGENSHNWKADADAISTGHKRAQKLFKNIGSCSKCGSTRWVERHHKDDNPLNNDPANIEILCRKCHIAVGGATCKPGCTLHDHGSLPCPPGCTCAKHTWRAERRKRRAG